MNRLSILICAAAAASLLASCAKTETSGMNDANKRYLESWLKINHPGAVKDGLGIYILDETPGTGKAAGKADDYPYAYVSYTTSDLEGNIKESTDADVAKRLGTFNEANYYGPIVLLRNSTAMTAGQEMVLDPMRVGGSRTAVIPGWFNTSAYRYETEEDYLNNVSGDDSILSVTLHDVISDITQWQLDSIDRYMARTFTHPEDSLKYGFYYYQLIPPSDTTSFETNDAVYINYTGRLLNGKVFDTTNEKTAKDAGIYNASSTYEPRKITLAEDYTDYSMTVGSSTAGFVDGFSYCLSLMKTGERGICIFYSDLGYQGSTKGNIPAFSPLRFEIEMIGKNLK